jgi:hypothetical protein
MFRDVSPVFYGALAIEGGYEQQTSDNAASLIDADHPFDLIKIGELL